MKPNPYSWQAHYPRRGVLRDARVTEIVEHVRRGAAVKIIGGRGMGKSVLMQQVEARLKQEPGTRVIMIESPPEESTVAGAVRDLATRLGVRDLSVARMDDLLDQVIQGSVTRLVALLDETDQYVGGGGGENAVFARSWFNKLEATRRQYALLFDVVFAGGLGLLYLEHEIGSGIVSRAEPCVLDPFSPASILNLPETPTAADDPIERLVLDVIAVLTNLRRFGRDFHQKSKPASRGSILSVAQRRRIWLAGGVSSRAIHTGARCSRIISLCSSRSAGDPAK